MQNFGFQSTRNAKFWKPKCLNAAIFAPKVGSIGAKSVNDAKVISPKRKNAKFWFKDLPKCQKGATFLVTKMPNFGCISAKNMPDCVAQCYQSSKRAKGQRIGAWLGNIFKSYGKEQESPVGPQTPFGCDSPDTRFQKLGPLPSLSVSPGYRTQFYDIVLLGRPPLLDQRGGPTPPTHLPLCRTLPLGTTKPRHKTQCQDAGNGSYWLGLPLPQELRRHTFHTPTPSFHSLSKATGFQGNLAI